MISPSFLYTCAHAAREGKRKEEVRWSGEMEKTFGERRVGL